MSRLKPGRSIESMKRKILRVSAAYFLQRGFTSTTLKSIAEGSDYNIGSVMHLFPSKEDILSSLVEYVIDGQFNAAKQLVGDKSDDPLLHFAVETVLQLHITETSEAMRDLYSAAYSLPKVTKLIHFKMTPNVQHTFSPYLPDYQEMDFYELEIATAGIMRSYVHVPCTMYFTMERKVRRYLETCFAVYHVPQADIDRALDFITQFDFPRLANETVESLLDHLSDEE